jgi:predicted Fe-S protein YdhL (DUF1289 family)
MNSNICGGLACGGCAECGLCQSNAECAADDGVPSPCIQVCHINETTGWCEGCFRRLEEICGWPAMSAADRQQVLERVGQRRASVQAQPETP